MRGLLASEADISVVAEATTTDDAIRLTEEVNPDVILMDIRMPGGNGISATRTIIDKRPNIRVLMVTMLEDDDSLFAAMRAGARGYLLKDASRDEVLRAIRAVAHDEVIFSPGVARKMLNFFRGKPQQQNEAQAFSELSTREREVLELLAKGRSNTTIAAELGLSLKTVQNHVSNLLGKLEVEDRVEAAIRAREAGLGRDDD
jgi:DNA-binding NarL/FixJ family response regulator